MSELDFASAEHLAGLIRTKQLSPIDLVDHTLARIDALNPSLAAFVALDPERARAEARSQTERLARGELLGPLGGLPFGVKDLENAAGFVTAYGSRVFKDNLVHEDDIHVARLKAAGAIVVGKTNTPEFGHIPFTATDLFPTARNPWNLERTPGGSSGGSAAAVASGMLALATASDGGGSVRIPACYTGLFGLKTSFGRVPIRPRSMMRWLDTSVYGPMTRTVRDAALYLDQVAGWHPADPDALPTPHGSYLERLDQPLGRLRIAVNRTLGVTRVQPDVLREVEAAVDVFRALGHEVVDNEDTIPETGGWWARMGAFQGLASLWDEYTTHHDEFTARYVAGLDAAHDIGPTDFREFYTLRAQLNEWAAGLFSEYDLLLTPTLPTEAFPAEGPVPTEIDGKPANGIAFTYPFNFTGHPAASVRAGFTDAGLPCGLQIVGQRHRDDLVLQASYAYERERPWQHWPSL